MRRAGLRAADADTAIKDAAKEFNIEDTKELIAVLRQTARHAG